MQTDWALYDAQGVRKYLTAEEGQRFIASAAGMCPRIHAFCLLLAYTGCRISEALALTRNHLDAETGRVRFRTLKRRKLVFRHVPVPPALIATLLQLPCAGEDARLWSWSRQTAYEKVKLTMRRAGIEGIHACPKGLRHRFAILAASRGVPEPLIQRWMGHARPQTTAIYAQAVGREEQAYAERLWAV